jgi:hypothetical protein
MILADDTKTIYGVFRGMLRHRKGQPYVDLNRAVRVGSVEILNTEVFRPSYLEIAKEFETWEALAYDFGRK